MRRIMRRLGEFLRDVGLGIDAGHAIRLGLPVPEPARRHPSDRRKSPWADLGPAQPGQVNPWDEGWGRQS